YSIPPPIGKNGILSICFRLAASKKRNSMSKGKERWGVLKNAIVEKRIGDGCESQSTRNSFCFNLFTRKKCNCLEKACVKSRKEENDCRWFAYVCNSMLSVKDIWINHPNPKTNLKEITSFNNTGNVCIWPSEEIMAYYCMSNLDLFCGKSVIELGGGSSSLAAMCIAFNSPSTRVLITDGNGKCVNMLNDAIHTNQMNVSNGTNKAQVSATDLRWDMPATYSQYTETFDFALCADCLFFDEFRSFLVDTIYSVLKVGGTAFIFAPQRGNTFHNFAELCKLKFTDVVQIEQYNHHIYKQHLEYLIKNKSYKSDVHFPILLKVRK
uniref:Calmodulin-lysine N-methyltransferase n=2 Tax=Ciona intestinalis TaxID=7719 RepID=F7AGV8_CIOIN